VYILYSSDGTNDRLPTYYDWNGIYRRQFSISPVFGYFVLIAQMAGILNKYRSSVYNNGLDKMSSVELDKFN
jgi:hypothetical protein